MKKTYLTPKVLENSMDCSCSLLNNSITAPLSGNDATTTEGNDYQTLSRRHSQIWDDEVEMEEE